MRKLFKALALLLIPTSQIAAHAEFMVTSVVRDVPMRSGDPQYKDIYINAGSNNGLRDGAYIDIKRKISAFDNLNSRLIGEVPVKVARVKLIHVDKSISIGRIVKAYSHDSNPLTGFDGVMIGDIIEVSENQ